MLLHGKLRSRNQFWVTEHEVIGERASRGRAHARPRAGLSGDARGSRRERLRTLAWEASERIRDVVEPLPGRLRAAEGLADRAGGAGRRALPGRAGGPGAGARTGSRSRSCSCSSWRSRGASAHARSGARARELPGTGELVEPVARRRFPFEPTGDQREGVRPDRRRPRAARADAAAADGGGRKRQDGGRAARDAARRGERRAGGVHGAHGDAGRAAHGHDRPPARRARAGRRCSRARRPPRAGARCSTGWPPASSGWSSARMR